MSTPFFAVDGFERLGDGLASQEHQHGTPPVVGGWHPPSVTQIPSWWGTATAVVAYYELERREKQRRGYSRTNFT